MSMSAKVFPKRSNRGGGAHINVGSSIPRSEGLDRIKREARKARAGTNLLLSLFPDPWHVNKLLLHLLRPRWRGSSVTSSLLDGLKM